MQRLADERDATAEACLADDGLVVADLDTADQDEGRLRKLNLSGHSGYQFDASTRAISTGYRFFVYDYYTKTSKTVDVSTNAYSGDSAEAVVEHPGLLSGLSNFGTMSFNQTEANGNYFSNYTKSRLEVWMYDPFGTLMASTSDIGANGSFTATQHSCN